MSPQSKRFYLVFIVCVYPWVVAIVGTCKESLVMGVSHSLNPDSIRLNLCGTLLVSFRFVVCLYLIFVGWTLLTLVLAWFHLD